MRFTAIRIHSRFESLHVWLPSWWAVEECPVPLCGCHELKHTGHAVLGASAYRFVLASAILARCDELDELGSPLAPAEARAEALRIWHEYKLATRIAARQN